MKLSKVLVRLCSQIVRATVPGTKEKRRGSVGKMQFFHFRLRTSIALKSPTKINICARDASDCCTSICFAVNAAMSRKDERVT